MPPDYAVHSDFLIHWTGKDLDKEYETDPKWFDNPKGSKTDNPDLKFKYLKRLNDTLKYGLWLTAEPDVKFNIGPDSITIPSTSKVCFTELKLSESQRHARDYGRLGIGFKRPYLFNRGGRPCAYFGFHGTSHKDPFLTKCASDLDDKTLLNFFKPMNSSLKELNYDLYSESEWRILYADRLLKEGLLIDPTDPKQIKHHKFYKSLSADQRKTLKYLAPLDGWFSMVIYPSISTKNAGQHSSSETRQLIESIKQVNDHAYKVEGPNWPIEVNLDSCRNF